MPAPARRNFDPACHELALLFLDDDPELIQRADELAAHIQAEIEAWIEAERDGKDGE